MIILRIAGTITLFFRANINIIRSRKNAATIKKPPAVLSTKEPTQKAKPTKAKNKKKMPKSKAEMLITAPDAALETPCVALALVN